MNFLTSSVVKAESTTDFAAEQAAQVQTFMAANPGGRTPRTRSPRTRSPQGPARTMFAADLRGTSDEMRTPASVR